MKWSELFWGKPTAVIATVGITVCSFVTEFTARTPTVIALGAFLVVHATIGFWRERRVVYRLGLNYQGVLRRTLNLVVELARLTGDDTGLWIIELYLPRHQRTLHRSWPFVAKKVLTRELTVTLRDVAMSPAMFDVDHAVFGSCYEKNKASLWWDPTLVNIDADATNCFESLDQQTNKELCRDFGSFGTWPLVDGLGKNCLGILLVHTGRDEVVSRKVCGALVEQQTMYQVTNAISDIHDKMSAS